MHGQNLEVDPLISNYPKFCIKT